MSRALVLNATYEPLGVVTERRALLLVLNTRATMVESSGNILHFAKGQIELPSVIRLNKFVYLFIISLKQNQMRNLFTRECFNIR
jgi:hypothetical protein